MNNRLKLNLRLEFSFALSHEHVFGSDPCLEVTCRLVLTVRKHKKALSFLFALNPIDAIKCITII